MADPEPMSLADAERWAREYVAKPDKERRREVAGLLTGLDRLRARETALVEALAEAGRLLDESERRVTIGGRAPRVDASWANLALPAPPSAGDDTAPPLHRRTRDEDSGDG